MKKVLFLLLFFVVFGAANMSAQVRIGGDLPPNEAAVLDLNADNATDGTKGLALPRVQLESDDAKLDEVTDNLDGMLVYNTSGSLPAGVYFWNGSNWIIGLTDTIPGGGLTKTGNGNVGIKTGGVTTAMIADGAVTADKLQKRLYTTSFTVNIGGSASVGTIVYFSFANITMPSWFANCNASNSWVTPGFAGDTFSYNYNGSTMALLKLYAQASNPSYNLFCYF